MGKKETIKTIKLLLTLLVGLFICFNLYDVVCAAESCRVIDYASSNYEGDIIEYYYIFNDVIEFDSTKGPQYDINYKDGSIVNCSWSGAVLKKCEVNGDILTLIVYSEELPVDVTYTFNIAKHFTPEEIQSDYSNELITYYKFNKGNQVEIYTSFGNKHIIDYVKPEIIESSISDAKIMKCETKDEILTICLYSETIQQNITYVVELPTDNIQYYNVYEDGTISFDTTHGPYYYIDYVNGKILDCTSTNPELFGLKKEGNILYLTLCSDEYAITTTYEFDLTKSMSVNPEYIDANEEAIEWYNVYTDNIIEFDSLQGPLYTIDYNKKKVIGCTSRNPQLISCKVNNNILTVRVKSDELPKEMDYEFDLTKNNVGTKFESQSMGRSGHGGKGDAVDYFNILTNENAIEFDSAAGPYYKISLEDGKILECTSDWLYPNKKKAKTLFFLKNDQYITISVYCAELPKKMTYIFNLSNNTAICGVSNYDEKALQKEVSDIIDMIVKGKYKDNGVDSETAQKIKKAFKEGRKITAKVETHITNEDDISSTDRQKIDKCLNDENMESVQYIDIKVALYTDGERLGNVSKLQNPISFELLMNKKNKKVDYCIVHSHKGSAADIIDLKRKAGNELSFETDRFSIFAIAKPGKPVVDKKSIKLKNETFVFDGKVHKPKLAADIKNNSGKTIKTSYYTISYENCSNKLSIKSPISIGKYNVVITFKGKYSGTVKKEFSIIPKGVGIKSAIGGKRKITLQWKKGKKGISGYEICYSTSAKFVKSSTKSKMLRAKKQKTTIKKLKSNKKYYVRIRTYQVVKINKKNVKIFSNWSKVKGVRVR